MSNIDTVSRRLCVADNDPLSVYLNLGFGYFLLAIIDTLSILLTSHIDRNLNIIFLAVSQDYKSRGGSGESAVDRASSILFNLAKTCRDSYLFFINFTLGSIKSVHAAPFYYTDMN